VIAHEIGHMLLGTIAHSPVGLMRAEWVARDVHRDFPADWLFSTRESIAMRQRLTERALASLESEGLMAHAAGQIPKCPPSAMPLLACLPR
jgi:hypothetical protein